MTLREVSSTDSAVDDTSVCPESAWLGLGGIDAAVQEAEQLSTLWFEISRP